MQQSCALLTYNAAALSVALKPFEGFLAPTVPHPPPPEAAPAHRCPQLGPEHLDVLAVLALQPVHVALHLEDGVHLGGLAGRQEAAAVGGREEDAGVAVVEDVLRLQEQLLSWGSRGRGGVTWS